MKHLIPQPRSITPAEGFFHWDTRSAIAPKHLLGLASAQATSSWTLGQGQRIEFCADESIKSEGYKLVVREASIQIFASDLRGRLFAIQTLIQLAEKEDIPCCTIEDAPRFGWRGMMLDPSRHFLPKAFVLKFIDLLVMHKMSSLHLHLCDDQGWRIEIKAYPKLTEVGAWRRATPLAPGSDVHDGQIHGGFYTQQDLRDIVRYATERGINVVPEIELPGHCQAAVAAYPELGNTGKALEPSIRFGVIEDVYGVQDETIRFLENVLTEVLDIFPSPFIHVGGDEVPKAQWKASPVAQKKMKELGLKDEEELQSWFIRHFDQWLAERGRRLIGWDEILEGGLAKGATVMSWRGFEGGIAAAKLGHDVVMAPTGYCYFDHYQSQIKAAEPTAIGGFLPLKKVYEFEPVPPELSAEEAKHVLGGQGQLWSEYMRTTDQVEYMALPRLCALSEVLWGKPSDATFDDFERRLTVHLTRLERENFRYRPLQPELPPGYHRIGGWKLSEIGSDPVTLEFEIPGAIKLARGFSIAVHYSGGAYGVWIDTVEVASQTGSLTASHKGSTGNIDEDNVFVFPTLEGPATVRVTLRSKGSGPLERNTMGDVFAVLPAECT